MLRKNWVASAQGMLKRCACQQFRPSGRVIVGSLLPSNNDPGCFDHAGQCFVALGGSLLRKNWVATTQGVLKRCACAQFRPSGRVIVGSLLLSSNDPGRFDHAGRRFVGLGGLMLRKNWVATTQGVLKRCACAQFRP